MTKLVIYGNSTTAAVVSAYIEEVKDIELVAFTVERKMIGDSELYHKPVVPFEELLETFPPSRFQVLILTAVGTSSPRLAKKAKSEELRNLGYTLFTFIDPSAFVASTARIGENCIIFNQTIVEPFATIGDGTILRSASYISHHSTVGEYCYFSPRACIAGNVKVESFCFLGVNCTIHDNVMIGSHSIIGGGAVVHKDVAEYGVIKGTPGILLKKDSTQFNI